MTKIKLKQSTHTSCKVLLFGRELEISDACMNIRFRPGYSRSHWDIQWCGGTECGTKRGHSKLYSKNRSGGGEGAVPVTAWHMQHVKSGLVGNT